MPNNRKKSSYKNKRYHPPNNKENGSDKHSYEFCSYQNYMPYAFHALLGADITAYNDKEIKSIIRDPMTNNQQLRNISWIAYNANGSYTNTVDYMVAMPTLSNVLVTKGQSQKKKNQNKKLMEVTLEKIKHKEFIRDALFKGMIEGIGFYYFETVEMPKFNYNSLNDFEVDSIVELNASGINASIIPLPADYTRIVGVKNNNYIIAFNLDYFDLDFGESVEKRLLKYPKEIRDGYAKRHRNSEKNNNWLILDNTKTIVHKVRSKHEERWGRPLVLAALEDILYGDYFTETKRNVLDDINNRIIYQTFPEGKEKGTSALTKEQQTNQHQAVKGAVLNKNNRGGTSFFSVAAGTKISTVDPANTDIFDDKYESKIDDKISLGLGIASSLLNGVGSGTYSAQTNNLELLSAQIFQWIEQITNELNKCINANIIRDVNNPVKCVYLPITYVNQNKMVGFAKELYLQGCGSLSLWAASTGIPVDAFYALLDQEIQDGVYEKYQPHMTSYTLSKDWDGGGRPETDNPSDNTVKSRDNGGNNLPSPSDNK